MDEYAVVGEPVEHSLSPDIHLLFAKQMNHPMHYTRHRVSVGTLHEFLQFAESEKIRGLNIKYPLKQEAFQLAHGASVRAQAAQAASCLTIDAQGYIYADNFDGMGLLYDLQNIQQIELASASVLLIGAGNVAKSVLPLLLDITPCITLANRTLLKAQQVVDTLNLKNKIPVISLSDLNTLSQQFDLVINLTAASLQQDPLHLPTTLFTQKSICYDVEYQRGGTAFTQWVTAQGLYALDGLGMLVGHNAEVFHLWRGVYPDAAVVYSQLKQQLS